MIARWLDRTRQRWKARTAYVFASVVVVAFVTMLLTDNVRLMGWAIIAFVAASIGFAAFMLSVKCRVCDEYVMLSIWKSSRDPIGRLESLESCPNCGAGTNEDRFV